MTLSETNVGPKSCCHQSGYDIIHIWEDELESKEDVSKYICR